jgi:hypothetical protein
LSAAFDGDPDVLGFSVAVAVTIFESGGSCPRRMPYR